MNQNFDQHKAELKKTFLRIKQNIELTRKAKLNPYNICIDILEQVKDIENQKATKRFVANRIRKFHDFFGWMSKGCIDNNGLCAGAIYRTEKYLQIPLKQRTGKKRVTFGFHRVHIEHSVPINDLIKILQIKREQLNSPKEVFELLFENSVCTAFSHEEEKTGILSGYSRNLGEGNLINRDEIFPLKRYNNNVKVINILTGSNVPHNTSLKSLTEDYAKIGVYNWDLIENYYKNKSCRQRGISPLSLPQNRK